MTQIAEQVSTSDAWCTTGTSPGPLVIASPRRADSPRPFDTIHLLGPGAVGRELLKRVASERRRLLAVSDSSGTVYDPAGLDALELLKWKTAGRPLSAHPLAWRISAAGALAAVDADIVVDTTATDLARSGWTEALTSALERGACVVSAAKASLCAAGAEWLSGEHAERVGCNAVLGGTGRSFTAELDDLRGRARSIAIVGNASTTAIIEAIEKGATLAEGAAEALRRGFLEPDPELDFRGTDAAVKLAIVAGIISGRRIDPFIIPVEDVRSLDPFTIRARTRRNSTTRLVGRWSVDGTLRVSYEEVSRDSLLAAPCGRVVYEYRLARDERRLHIGTGLGAAATADALWTDIRTIAPRAALRAAGGAR